MLGVFDLNDGEMLLSIGLRIMIPCYLKEIDFEPSCTDEYFAVQEVSTVFIIQGKMEQPEDLHRRCLQVVQWSSADRKRET